MSYKFLIKRRKIIVAFLLLSVFLSVKSFAQFHIIPQPNEIKKRDGNFLLNEKTIIEADDSSMMTAKYLQSYLSDEYHLSLKIKSLTGNLSNAIVIKTSDNDSIKGAYKMVVSSSSILIKGNNDGTFYAIQTLLQLLPDNSNSSLSIPACAVKDAPHFQWRGLSLDVVRHFFSVEEVKKYIDVMVHYKLNIFHWHLTDDEGWRIQIDKYPLLTEKASRINYYAQLGQYRPLDNLVDHKGSDGFYTKDQIREVIKYAAERHITILPEIEMPGHSEAAIFAYPELGTKDSTGEKHRVRMLEPSEYTFNFYENVLSEVIDLFPNQYIHIGGDEAEMSDWLKDPVAVALMQKEGLKNEREIQSYFIKRIEKFLLSKNKKLVGWDEILQGGLAETATVMSWRGEQGGIDAARMHHHVVMTPLPYMYFDAPQANESLEPIGWNPPVPWQMVYNYEPLSDKLTTEEASYILGLQGNIWNEKIATNEHLEYMVFPRALAVAETGWSEKENKNIDRFKQKLNAQYAYFKMWNLNARLPNIDGIVDVVTNKNSYQLNLSYPLKDAKVQYTLNGKKPDSTAFQQNFPLQINIKIKDTTVLYTNTSWQLDHQHFYQKATFTHIDLQPKNDIKISGEGLQFSVYKTNKDIQKTDSLTADTSGIIKTPLNIPYFSNDEENIWVKVNGFLKIDKEDDYELTTEFEKSPGIFLDSKIIIREGLDKYVEPQRAVLHLAKGYYAVIAFYNSNAFDNKQNLLQLKNGEGKVILPDLYLFH